MKFCATSLKSTSNLISFLNARQVAIHTSISWWTHTHTHKRACLRAFVWWFGRRGLTETFKVYKNKSHYYSDVGCSQKRKCVISHHFHTIERDTMTEWWVDKREGVQQKEIKTMQSNTRRFIHLRVVKQFMGDNFERWQWFSVAIVPQCRVVSKKQMSGIKVFVLAPISWMLTT